MEDILDDETADKPPDFKMLNDEFYQVVIEGSTGQYPVHQYCVSKNRVFF